MSLNIFFAEDIRNALLAANEAGTSTARACAAVGQVADLPLLRAYLEGYRAALVTVALAFGLDPDTIAGRQGEILARVREMRTALDYLNEKPATMAGFL